MKRITATTMFGRSIGQGATINIISVMRSGNGFLMGSTVTLEDFCRQFVSLGPAK